MKKKYYDTSSKFFDNQKEVSPSPEWMTVQDAANYLRTTPAAIRNRLYRRELSFYRPFGRRVLLKRKDLDHLIESSKIGGLR